MALKALKDLLSLLYSEFRYFSNVFSVAKIIPTGLTGKMINQTDLGSLFT